MNTQECIKLLNLGWVLKIYRWKISPKMIKYYLWDISKKGFPGSAKYISRGVFDNLIQKGYKFYED